MPLDLPYRATILTGLAWFKAMDFRFQISGQENVPRTGGAVLAINHISYLDFIMAGYGAHPSRRLVRFMAKRETFDHPVSGPLMRSYHHISVDRSEGVASYRNAVDYLRRGEVVGVFPEATISRSFEIKDLKSGAVRLAAEAEVPLIPLILWGSQRIMTKDHPKDFSRGKTIAVTVGDPLHPTGENAVAETAELKATMARLLDDTIAAYPAQEQPPGSWWLPARLGGSAPTPEQAKELDAAELRERAAKRAAKRTK
ncbi:lysophospholipid acyltransferase family protein [Nocardioides massiliensis]|uniref:1-acyl-sn-glycerol-3-phosphate acyltransferase n=1 Tax=Nocardioides massiliensis TaxID=1325935 RepID=A0ABT9NLL4_9ACTN|nr:lysophospholipid acyltransferase family protein [Nocardioides massiliensis]MDP9821320.1 1-acyl-sn-glycerol-3-phosphate acyltransferase [Nocardioides massiliensis]